MLIFILILCIIFCIAVTNVYVSAVFNENGFSGNVRILFFRLYFPKKKNRSEEKKKDSELTKKPGKLKDLKSLVDPAIKALGKLLRFICIRNIDMDIIVGSSDAFLTAMLYGGAAAGIGILFPVLNQNFKVKRNRINVTADFSSSETVVYMNTTVSIAVWQIFVIAYVFAIRYLKNTFNKRKDDKNGRTRTE